MKITRQFIISSAMHVAIVLLLLLVTVKSAKLLKPEPYRVTLTAGESAAQAAEIEQPAPSPTPPPPPKIETKAPKMFTKKVIKKKIKKIESIKPLDEHPIRPLPPVEPTKKKPGASGGPSISTGGDSVWDMMVQNRITANWSQPSKAETGADPPAAEYEIVVERNGKISNIRKKRSSGIPALDNSARNALDKSNPLPKLPKTFNGQSKTVPIIFRIKDSF